MPVPSTGRNVYHFGQFTAGPATDSRFAPLIERAVTPTCNDVATTAAANQVEKDFI